ncbi:MAG: D-amino-acid dehydrogenase [Arenicella sp.]|jgi:D-amino-acid dehydrogenase
MADKIIIIGVGVIGAATALALSQDGHTVTLIDRYKPCAGASFGNVGAIVNGSCESTAMPRNFV